ncbi:YjcQ family protein [Pseudobutyrivibrio xylanivorans]|uniref:Uncharacterized protein n=1 Tax=Pseudobutyrivibrio xylanivorans TaxID=185007 RepID=A0A5P6VTD0_PSEXY|nr:hypothetical protein [Pseudobutyrivibrio xylanivorans]QFJ55009.1 hypothetical protein FXF36_09105 [Pseudobutyrivibrio xylanivorans]
MISDIKLEILKGIKKGDVLAEEFSLDSDQFLKLVSELVCDGHVEGVIFPKDKFGKQVLANMTRAHLTEKGETILNQQI